MVSTDRATAVGKLTSCILFVWLVERVGVIVGCLLATTTDSSVISCATAVLDHAAARVHGSEVSNVQGTIVALNATSTSTTHVAMDRLLARVMPARMMMEPSLIELVGSNLAQGILVFCRSCSEVTAIALVDWVASSARCSLLP